MKTFEMKSRPNRLMFQNFARADEAEIFNDAVEKLRKVSGITLSDVKEAPYVDVVNGHLESVPFSIFLDFDYGAEVFCEDPEKLQQLKKLLDQD